MHYPCADYTADNCCHDHVEPRINLLFSLYRNDQVQRDTNSDTYYNPGGEGVDFQRAELENNGIDHAPIVRHRYALGLQRRERVEYSKSCVLKDISLIPETSLNASNQIEPVDLAHDGSTNCCSAMGEWVYKSFVEVRSF